jgi:hypothetical protein
MAIETRRPLRHVGKRCIQPGQLAVHLLTVARAGGLGERAQVGKEDVGEDQTRQLGVLQARPEHLLDSPVGTVSGLGELVDMVPVAVLGEVGGARPVVTPVKDLPVGECIKEGLHLPHRARRGHIRVLCGHPAEQGPRVGGVQQHLVLRPGPVEGTQQPQILTALLGGREMEQPQPVVQREGVDTEAALRTGGRGAGLGLVSGGGGIHRSPGCRITAGARPGA